MRLPWVPFRNFITLQVQKIKPNSGKAWQILAGISVWNTVFAKYPACLYPPLRLIPLKRRIGFKTLHAIVGMDSDAILADGAPAHFVDTGLSQVLAPKRGRAAQ